MNRNKMILVGIIIGTLIGVVGGKYLANQKIDQIKTVQKLHKNRLILIDQLNQTPSWYKYDNNYISSDKDQQYLTDIHNDKINDLKNIVLSGDLDDLNDDIYKTLIINQLQILNELMINSFEYCLLVSVTEKRSINKLLNEYFDSIKTEKWTIQ